MSFRCLRLMWLSKQLQQQLGVCLSASPAFEPPLQLQPQPCNQIGMRAVGQSSRQPGKNCILPGQTPDDVYSGEVCFRMSTLNRGQPCASNPHNPPRLSGSPNTKQHPQKPGGHLLRVPPLRSKSSRSRTLCWLGRTWPGTSASPSLAPCTSCSDGLGTIEGSA